MRDSFAQISSLLEARTSNTADVGSSSLLYINRNINQKKKPISSKESISSQYLYSSTTKKRRKNESYQCFDLYLSQCHRNSGSLCSSLLKCWCYQNRFFSISTESLPASRITTATSVYGSSSDNGLVWSWGP